MTKLLKGVLLFTSISAFSSPAHAGYWWCGAINRPDSGGVEKIISNTFQREDGIYSRAVDNDWYDHLKANGWIFNSEWGCVGPYETQEDSVYAAKEDARNLQAQGWSVYFSENRAWMR